MEIDTRRREEEQEEESSVERPSAPRHLHRYVTPEWDAKDGEERKTSPAAKRDGRWKV